MALSKKNVKKVAFYLNELSKSYCEADYRYKTLLELQLGMEELISFSIETNKILSVLTNE